MNNHRKVFYGWWLAIAAGVALCLGGPPILVFSFPVFLKAFTKEFHASRSAISLAFSLHNVVGAVGAPPIGRLVDRIGARRIIILGTMLLASLLMGNRLMTVNVWGIYIFNMAGVFTGAACGPSRYSTVI